MVSQHCPDLQAMCLFTAGKTLCQSHVSNWMSTISRPFMHPGHLLPHSPEHWLMMFIYTPMSTVYSFSLKHFYSGYLVIHFSPSSHSILPSLFFKPQGIFRVFFLSQFLTYISMSLSMHVCAVFYKHLSSLNPNKRQFMSWSASQMLILFFCLSSVLWQWGREGEWEGRLKGRQQRKRHARGAVLWCLTMCQNMCVCL